MDIDRKAFHRTVANTRGMLLSARSDEGFWEGKLSSSALSTATAVCALALADRESHSKRIESGLAWLEKNRNPDNGFGDTVISRSNISTTTLCWAALAAAGEPERFRDTALEAGQWIEKEAGGLDARSLAKAISSCYGGDRTFSVPILTMCALSGRFGEGRRAWQEVKPLPFELAAMPRVLMRWMRLTVVSYALPALVAIGQTRHHLSPPANPVTRLIRGLTRERTLRLLSEIQPESGGFLEAIPLTSFVVMSLAAAGRKDHPVLKKGVEFLIRSMRDDGSWPIDTNLATWVTTLSVNSIANSSSFHDLLDEPARRATADWLVRGQTRAIDPYTMAKPGGWAWTDLPGGVPDADDTSGALLAMYHLGLRNERIREAACAGVAWLTSLQNRDGGVPTFCRGWNRLAFDRSAPDLTAHALSAASAWSSEDVLPLPLNEKAAGFMCRGAAYLRRVQQKNGAWIPLWFGNESVEGMENPVYGTARVLSALSGLPRPFKSDMRCVMDRAAFWLSSAQNRDGGWGSEKGAGSTIEETALSVHTLAGHAPGGSRAVSSGISWLIENTREGTEMKPAPIGLYFAKLWYFEELYPVIFSLMALERVERLIE